MSGSGDEEEAAMQSQQRRAEQALRAIVEYLTRLTHRQEADGNEAWLQASLREAWRAVDTLRESLEREAWLRTALEQERRVVETLQQGFLRREMPKVPGAAFGHGYWPARQEERVGGDFYDVVPLDAHHLAFCIGDVSGSGIQAALLTTTARNMWRGFLVEDSRLETLMARLNNALVHFMESEQFVTMLCGLIDRCTGDLQYVVAGHPPPLVRRATGGCEALPGRGMVLGVFPDMPYETQETCLGIGDLLLLYTDGMSELRRRGEMLEIEGLRRWLGECPAEAPAEVVRLLYERAREWCGGPFGDDVALVAIRWLERAPGTIPEAAAPASAAARRRRISEAAAPASAAISRRRILVVEDNRDLADTQRELLELWGYEVAVAYSGPEAVAAARRFRPEVVLCDLELPGMDGCAVAAELRRDPATAAARLIAVTSWREEEDRRRSRAAGFELHLTKPVNPVALEQILAALPPSG